MSTKTLQIDPANLRWLEAQTGGRRTSRLAREHARLSPEEEPPAAEELFAADVA